MMYQYIYEGPVEEFGRCINPNWKGITWAVSEAKARCNLTYQYKKAHNYISSAKLNLPGKVELVA